MPNDRSGQVSMTVDGKRFTGYYRLEAGTLEVSTEIGTLRKPYASGSLKHQAEGLLARLVREELKGS